MSGRTTVDGEIMTLRDVARYLHCEPVTIYRLLSKRAIPGIRAGDWRLRRWDIDKWIDNRTIVVGGQNPDFRSVRGPRVYACASDPALLATLGQRLKTAPTYRHGEMKTVSLVVNFVRQRPKNCLCHLIKAGSKMQAR